jgi:hypothetical protein
VGLRLPSGGAPWRGVSGVVRRVTFRHDGHVERVRTQFLSLRQITHSHKQPKANRRDLPARKSDDADVPLPEGAGGTIAAAGAGRVGSARLVQGDAGAGVQCGAFPRARHGQALSAIRRRHDIGLFDPADL